MSPPTESHGRSPGLSKQDAGELYRAYSEACAEAGYHAKYATAPSASVCRYCGKLLPLARLSSVDGHAQCVVTVEFQLRVLELLDRTPMLAISSVAKCLGVTYGVVRAWEAGGLKARRRR